MPINDLSRKRELGFRFAQTATQGIIIMLTSPTSLLVAVDNTSADNIADRVKNLQQQARVLANEHVNLLLSKLEEVNQIAQAINSGGDAYLAGIRTVALEVQLATEKCSNNIQAIQAKTTS